MPRYIYGFCIILSIYFNTPVKISLCLINYVLCHEDIWVTGVISPSFLISAQDGGEWSASRPGHFNPGGRETQVPTEQKAGWASGHSGCYGEETKSLASTWNRTPAVQPVARRYTDTAIP
jgi:hypothetical protein